MKTPEPKSNDASDGVDPFADRDPQTPEEWYAYRMSDWSRHPPTIIKANSVPVEELDPRNYDGFNRDMVIRRRRRAGLTDYPLDAEKQD